MSNWNDGVPRIGATLKEDTRAPETKSVDTIEVREAMDEFLSAFEDFKSANDERLGELERKLSADVIAEEKVERINKALDQQKKKLDELTLAARRPELAGNAESGIGSREHKRAFERYVRKGEAHELRGLEAKALSTQPDPDGGYLVPAETERMIDRIVSEVSPIRAIAGIRQIGSSDARRSHRSRRLTSALFGSAASTVGEGRLRALPTASPSRSSFVRQRR